MIAVCHALSLSIQHDKVGRWGFCSCQHPRLKDLMLFYAAAIAAAWKVFLGYLLAVEDILMLPCPVTAHTSSDNWVMCFF